MRRNFFISMKFEVENNNMNATFLKSRKQKAKINEVCEDRSK